MESPTNFVALGGGAGLADFLGDGALVCTTTPHLFEDTFGIKFGFQTLESTVDGLSIFDINATNMFLHKENPQGPTGSGKLGATGGDVKPAFIEKIC